MSRSPSNQSPLGQAEASSSRASNGKQPAVDDDHSDEEALLADDPLDRDLPEQYAPHNVPYVN
jgi:chloride channel 3/4/5